MNAIAQSPHKTAFTLVELSIVIVIIGLLVGGVLAGRSLIHASELRSVSNELARYRGVAQTFHDKYGAIPGDMPNATSLWGGVSGVNTLCSSALAASATASQLTCNGDNNGMVDWNNEMFAFWGQLANAGLIEGAYNSVPAPGGNSQMGVNVPASKLGEGTYWGALTGGNDIEHTSGTAASLGTTRMFAGEYGNNLYLGRSSFAPNAIPLAGVMTPTDTWSIDSKIDDGSPGSGKMIVLKYGTNGPCTTTDSTAPPGDSGSEYAIDNGAKVCNPMFLDAF